MPQRQEIRVFRQFSVFFPGQPLPPLTDLSLVLCCFLTATRAYCSSVFCINVTRQSEEALQPATNGGCAFAAAYPICYMPVRGQPNPKQVAEAAGVLRHYSTRETVGALIASSIFLAMWSGKWMTMPVWQTLKYTNITISYEIN